MLRLINIGTNVKKSNSISGQGYHLEPLNQEKMYDVPCKDIERQISILVRTIKKPDDEHSKEGFCRTRFKPDFLIETDECNEIRAKDTMCIGECEIEITISGKECHNSCPIFDLKKTCRLYKDIYFAKVVKSGIIKAGDTISLRRMDTV